MIMVSVIIKGKIDTAIPYFETNANEAKSDFVTLITRYNREPISNEHADLAFKDGHFVCKNGITVCATWTKTPMENPLLCLL